MQSPQRFLKYFSVYFSFAKAFDFVESSISLSKRLTFLLTLQGILRFLRNDKHVVKIEVLSML